MSRNLVNVAVLSEGDFDLIDRLDEQVIELERASRRQLHPAGIVTGYEPAHSKADLIHDAQQHREKAAALGVFGLRPIYLD